MKWAKYMMIVFGLVWLPAQENVQSIDDQFLNPGMFSESVEVDEAVEDTVDEEAAFDYDAENKKASIYQNLKIEEQYLYHHQRDKTVHQTELFSLPIFQNNLLLQNKMEFLSGNEFWGFSFKNTLIHRFEKENDSKTTSSLHNDLHEFYFSLYLLRSDISLNLDFGKIDESTGSANLINPTDLLMKEGSFVDSRLGFYKFKLSLFHELFDLTFSYYPDFDSGYREFQINEKNEGSEVGLFYTSISTAIDTLQGKTIFFWNGKPNVGLDLSLGVGSEIIIYLENALSHKRMDQLTTTTTVSLPIDQEGNLSATTTDYQRYEFKRELELAYEGVLGISYTPQSILNILFEVRYLSSAVDWDDEKKKLVQVSENRETMLAAAGNSAIPDAGLRASSAGLAAEYRGVLGDSLSDYDVFNYQPLFLSLRLSRDDFLENFISMDFNVATTLVYSPLDTGFIWRNEFSWHSKTHYSLSMEADWTFGQNESVFTTIPDELVLRFYAQFLI